MAVPPQLLQQLLALDESVRLEIAHALLASVDPSDADGMSDAEPSVITSKPASCDRLKTGHFESFGDAG